MRSQPSAPSKHSFKASSMPLDSRLRAARCTYRSLVLASLLAGSLMSNSAVAQGQASYRASATGLCGDLKNPFGPFDYRTATADQRDIVERHHFTSSVELLQKGVTGPIGADLNYTLQVFPNHPRALYAMSRYAKRLGTVQVPGARYPAECYFERATRFTPQDPQVRALYADFLIHFKNPKEARLQLQAADAIKDIPPDVSYNLGLAWLGIGEEAKAAEYAKRAYNGGVQFTALRDKLKAAGAWRD